MYLFFLIKEIEIIKVINVLLKFYGFGLIFMVLRYDVIYFFMMISIFCLGGFFILSFCI